MRYLFCHVELLISYLFLSPQVAKHNSPGDCWIIIDGLVYDVTHFALNHLGGTDIIYAFAGVDATKEFLDIHPPEYAWEYIGPAIGKVLMLSSPLSSLMPKAGLGFDVVDAESFAQLREALSSRVLTVTGGFGAMVQRYMREKAIITSSKFKIFDQISFCFK